MQRTTATEPVPNLNLAREQAAFRELGETSVAPGVARALVAAFVLTLLLVPVAERWMHDGHTAGVGSAFRDLAVGPVDACSIQAVEDRVEERSRVGKAVRPRLQALLTGLLRLGNEQVIVGRDGWLFQRSGIGHLTGRPFLDPEVQARRVRDADPCQTAPAPDPIAAILAFRDDLAARAIDLVIVPTPVKGVLEGEQLGGAPGGVVQNASFPRFLDELRSRGVGVFDPVPTLGQARRGSASAGLYLATDTHWRPAAMEAVAQTLAAFLEARVDLGAREPGWSRREVAVENRGDLAALLDLPTGAPLLPRETATIREVRTPGGRLWTPTRGASVLLLGDSFSNIYAVRAAFARTEDGDPLDWGEAAGLAEQLSFHLGRPVDRIARNAGGAHSTRRDLAREVGGGRDRLEGVRVVVWQFALRELSQGDWQQLPLPPRS